VAEEQRSIPQEMEAVVIGAGLLGCSIGYQLAKRGKRVLVIDKRGICSGASGRNGGMTGAGSAMHTSTGRAVYALTSENLRMLREELPRELEDDFSLRLPGTLDIATNEEQLEHLQSSTRSQKELGSDVEMLDLPALKSMVPVISDRVLGAKFARGSGHLWPFQLVHALANGARRFGAEFCTWTPATGISMSNGEVQGVTTERGSIAAETVVVAANSWTPTLLTDLPQGALVPARGQILATEAVGEVVRHPFGTNFDKEYGRQTATGQILCGGYRRLDVNEGLGSYEERVTPPVLQGIGSCIATLFPPLGSLKVVRSWAGIMGFTADGLPMIGSYGGVKNLYVAAGFNGGGFSWGAATGKALAQVILHGRAAFDLDPFDPNRFASGGVEWDNPFTAGEKNNPRKHKVSSSPN
jgi:glycine/D-amino acid oxidase-like deaminating enzyme